jgi:ADP-ribose pyrophosphatase YjhB (NUDIX family)
MKSSYRGAGILFSCHHGADVEILLGRRRHGPGRGTYSIPFGALNGGESYLDCAWREASEETAAGRHTCQDLIRPYVTKGCDPTNPAAMRLDLPRLHIRVFWVPLREKPPDWPRPNDEWSPASLGWYRLHGVTPQLPPGSRLFPFLVRAELVWLRLMGRYSYGPVT